MTKLFGLRRKSLQLRIVSFFLVSFIILGSALIFIGVANSKTVKSLYYGSLVEEKKALGRDLEDSSQLTKALAPDYSIWDSPYDYLNGKLPSYADDNLTEGVLGTFHSDAMWMFYKNGKLASKINMTEATEGEVDFSLIQKGIDQLFETGPRIHFYAKTRTGIMEIFGSKVARGDDLDQRKDSPGYLLTGKLINTRSLASFQEGQMVLVKFLSPQQMKEYPTELPPHKGLVALSIGFKSIDGKDLGSVYANYDNHSIRELHKSDMILLFLNAITFFSLLIGIVVVAWKWIIQPINAIYSSLESANTKNLRKISEQKTEFGKIALLIDKFFAQQESLKNEMQEKAVVGNELETKSRELTRTNDAMIDRELKMIDLKKELVFLRSKRSSKHDA